MGRRQGGVRFHGAGILIDFRYRGVRCRETFKLKQTAANKAWAERKLQVILHEIETGTFDYKAHFPDSQRAALWATPGEILTLGPYLDKWLKDAKEYTKASTWNGYRKIVVFQLVPEFGEIKLSDFKRHHVREWARKKSATAKTLGNILSPLRLALDTAVDEELIDVNPLSGWKIKRKRTGKADKVDPFSAAEREAILKAMSGQGRNLIEFALWTGMRTSELCALDWSDVDLINGFVYVSRALTQASKEAEGTKTDAGERKLKLLGPARAALEAQKAHTKLKGQEIFQNPRTNERWTGDQPIRKTLWEYALKRAEVRYRNPYQTRHTFASMMLMAGEPVQWVAQQMGHTDWAFTARTYARWIPEDAPDSGSKAEAKWSQSGPKHRIKR